MNIKSLGNLMLNVLVGEYNGIQVFLAPITMLYLIESDSLLASATSLLSFRIHFMPFLIFCILLIFMLFILIKLKLFHHGSQSEFVDKVIELNISVMALVFIALVLYALSSFLAYFYGIKGTIKFSMYFLFKFYTAGLIIYHYLVKAMLSPYYKRNYGFKRSLRAFLAWGRNHRMLTLRYVLVLILFVFAATRMYQLIINYALIPFIEGVNALLHADIRLRLYPFVHLDDVALNTVVCIAAFAISNLLFYPIIHATNLLIQRLIPLKAILGLPYAQTKN